MDWIAVTRGLLAEMESVDEMYRPTNYWNPGVKRLLDEMATVGVDRFKRWASAGSWFYPRYGRGLNNALMDRAHEAMQPEAVKADQAWVRSQLSGSVEARHDLEVAQAVWDQQRWPFDLLSHGESDVGDPPQRFRLTKQDGIHWGRPYLNYLRLMAALSKHVERPPRSFLEIGGGFGVLADVLAPRVQELRYVDVDIPPLVTVAGYYLNELIGGIVGPVDLPVGGVGPDVRVAVVPSWRIGDVVGPFDVFVNSYSFQEMEPEVVANYIRLVADIGVEWIVSCNSATGKRRAVEAAAGGALEPVTSSFIEAEFSRHGYQTAARYGRPYVSTATAELLIMRSTG